VAGVTAPVASWRAELAALRDVLEQGGVVVTTCDDHGAVLLRTIVQLDGDLVQIVTPDLLGAGPLARDAIVSQHRAQVGDRLATPLTRTLAWWRTWRGRVAAGTIALPAGTTAWQVAALLGHGLPGTAALLAALLPCAPVLMIPVVLPAIRFGSRAALRRLMAGW
jgi:hypothetical protein